MSWTIIGECFTDTVYAGCTAVGQEWCFFKGGEPWTSICLWTDVLLRKKQLNVQWDTISKCKFFDLGLYCSIDLL